MSSLDHAGIKEISEILYDHYYSIGVRNGLESIGNLFDDYHAGLLDDNLKEWGVTTETGEVDHLEFRGIIFWELVQLLMKSGELHEEAVWTKSGNSPASGEGGGTPRRRASGDVRFLAARTIRRWRIAAGRE